MLNTFTTKDKMAAQYSFLLKKEDVMISKLKQHRKMVL